MKIRARVGFTFPVFSNLGVFVIYMDAGLFARLQTAFAVVTSLIVEAGRRDIAARFICEQS